MKTTFSIRIAIIGSRGIPASYGGFETFAEELSLNLFHKHGFDIQVIGDAEQKKTNNSAPEFKGVKLNYSKYSKTENPLLFYLDSFRIAKDCHLIYSCGPGGGVFGFVPRWHGNLLITNPDGLNWKRSKWSPAVQKAFRIFDYLSCRFSQSIVCDSECISQYFRNAYSCRRVQTIEYGAYPNKFNDVTNDQTKKLLAKHELGSKAYHLIVARLEPENHVDMVLNGYCRKIRKYPLAVVGHLTATPYVKSLRNTSCSMVKFLGGIYDKDELSIIRANAVDYIHGHSVGGTNPSLLEAMASKNLCVCHDNEFNKEVVRQNGFYFKNADELSDIIDRIESHPDDFSAMETGGFGRITDYYNWDLIADRYARLFRELMVQHFLSHKR
jgi:glycosyltransferase involved in cell wall biosynthesis